MLLLPKQTPVRASILTSWNTGSYFRPNSTLGNVYRKLLQPFKNEFFCTIQNTGFCDELAREQPAPQHELTGRRKTVNISQDPETNLLRDGEGMEQDESSAASSLNSNEKSSECDQNDPAIQLQQVSLDELEDLDREVEAINYQSTTTADSDKRGLPIAIVVTPAIGGNSDKPLINKPEIPDDALIPKTESLSVKAAYGTTADRCRSASPVPSLLGEKARSRVMTKKTAGLVAVAIAIAVVWGCCCFRWCSTISLR